MLTSCVFWFGFQRIQGLMWSNHFGISNCLYFVLVLPVCKRHEPFVLVQFNSVQFKMVPKRSGKPICTPPHLSEVSPMLLLKQFQCWSDWWLHFASSWACGISYDLFSDPQLCLNLIFHIYRSSVAWHIAAWMVFQADHHRLWWRV